MPDTMTLPEKLRSAMTEISPLRYDRGTMSHAEKSDRAQRAIETLASCFDEIELATLPAPEVVPGWTLDELLAREG